MTPTTTMGGASVLPTDRPLTAGDVPLLREGDVLRANSHFDGVSVRHLTKDSEYIFLSKGHRGWIKIQADDQRNATFWTLGNFTFVARPATSAVSEVEGQDLLVQLDDYFDRYIGATRGEDMSLEEMLISKSRTVLAALASPPSEREREGDLAFGEGKLVVDTGKYHGRPAVFICPVAEAGVIGESARHLGHDAYTLQPGEQVLTFPTTEQATFVADALVGSALASPPSEREAVADILSHASDFREALRIADQHEETPEDGSGKPGYWLHQIKVLDRIVAALTAKPAGEPTHG